MKNTCIPFDIISKQSENVLFTDDVPSFFKDYKMLDAISTVAYGTFGHFYFQEQQHEDSLISMRYTNYFPAKDESFCFVNDQAELRLQFALRNNFYFNEQGIGETALYEGSFNMFYSPFLKSEQRLFSGNMYSIFSVHFSPAYLDSWRHHYPVISDFLIMIAKEEPALLCAINQMTTAQMDSIIRQLIQNHFTGVARLLYIDIKIKELFMLVLDKISNCPTLERKGLSKIEVEKFCEAKDILLKNIQNPMSLKQLSRRFGINTKKIKIGFKQLYEKTPFDLLLSTRMEKAKTMLSGTEKDITEIADEIGYDNKHSFSKAFKKYFGFPPGKFRKSSDEFYYKYSVLEN